MAVRLFPNPANDKLQFLLPEESIGMKVQVRNILGELVAQEKITALYMSLPTITFANGFYTCEILNERNAVVFSKKLTVAQ